jgi:transposase
LGTIPGVGPVLAAIFVAEMGEVCWFDLPPSRRSSSVRIHERSVSRLIPGSSAICAIVAPGRDRYNATASALNWAG